MGLGNVGGRFEFGGGERAGASRARVRCEGDVTAAVGVDVCVRHRGLGWTVRIASLLDAVRGVTKAKNEELR